MIPDLDDYGNLPPGIYPASLDEIDQRFARGTESRLAEMQSLRWLVDLAARTGVQRLVIDGSSVTKKREPNDIDCVLLIGPGFPRDRQAEEQLMKLPYLDVHLVDEEEFSLFVNAIFATDRRLHQRGMVEVIL